MEQVLQVNVVAVSFVVAWVIPLLVAALTKSTASSSVKAVLNLGLTVVTGAAACVIEAKGSVTVGQLGTAMMAAFTGSGLSYTHLWKPTGAAASVNAVAPGFGLGSASGDSTSVDVPEENPIDPVETPLPVVENTPEAIVSNAGPMNLVDGMMTPQTATEWAQAQADSAVLVGEGFLAIITPVITGESDK